MADKPRMPANLAAPGRSLWRAVVADYELRPDEIAVLEKACRTADDSARLDAALREAPLMVTGSMGQARANPLLHEARQSRALLATLLRQLALPQDQPAEGTEKPTTNTLRAMKAARARWGSAAPHGA